MSELEEYVYYHLHARPVFSRLNWHPAPPKLNVHPDVIQSELFPEYRGVVLADFEDDPTVDQISDDEQELEKLEEDRIAQEEAASLRRYG